MSDREKIVSRLIAERDFRADYIRAKLEVLIPSQLRALRLRQERTQPELARMADMKQSRISAMETPGKVNFNQETLVRMAATLNVGMKVLFVPFSEMLEWENGYSQDSFDVTQLADDIDFLEPAKRVARKSRARWVRRHASHSHFSSIPSARAKVAGVITSSQQGAQLNFDFSPTESQVPNRLADVIVLPTKNEAISHLLAAAAAGGSGRVYGQ